VAAVRESNDDNPFPIAVTDHARRLTFVLFGAQSLGSAGFLAASTVGAIVGASLSGRASWAGVPSGVYQGGSALAAYMWGRAMERHGRRPTLAAGLTVGFVGASLACAAVTLRTLPLFLFGLLCMGMANAALQLGRYVAAEIHPPAERARAIGRVVTGGTVGAIIGPLLVGPSASLAARLRLTDLSGPYSASALLFAAAALLIAMGLRPEPRELARLVAAAHGPAGGAVVARGTAELLRDPQVVAAVLSLVAAQAVMVMVMVITSLHMTHHDHALSSVSFVIALHVVGMYAFSLVSGRIADRWGRPAAVALGAVVLLVSCALAPLSPRVLPLAGALFALGLGWNLCYVGGSAWLSDRLTTEERARTQGATDTLVGLTAAVASLGSGIVFAAVGYGVMAAVGAAVALLPLGLSLLSGRPRAHGGA
jgi:MFS family permease